MVCVKYHSCIEYTVSMVDPTLGTLHGKSLARVQRSLIIETHVGGGSPKVTLKEYHIPLEATRFG